MPKKSPTPDTVEAVEPEATEILADADLLPADAGPSDADHEPCQETPTDASQSAEPTLQDSTDARDEPEVQVFSVLRDFPVTHAVAELLTQATTPIRRFIVRSTRPVEHRFPLRVSGEIIQGSLDNGYGRWTVVPHLMEPLSRSGRVQRRELEVVDIVFHE